MHLYINVATDCLQTGTIRFSFRICWGPQPTHSDSEPRSIYQWSVTVTASKRRWH